MQSLVHVKCMLSEKCCIPALHLKPVLAFYIRFKWQTIKLILFSIGDYGFLFQIDMMKQSLQDAI